MSDFQPMPALSNEQYAALRDSIATEGVTVPIVIDQHGRILDGHNRAEIADGLGINYPTVVRRVADDDDAWRAAVELNCARRHLTSEQKRAVIAEELRRCPDDSDRAIAKRVGCDHKTVGAVRRAGAGGEIPHPTQMDRAAAEESTQRARDALDKFFRSLVDAAIEMRREGLTVAQVVTELERFRRELYRESRSRFPVGEETDRFWEEITDQRFDSVIQMLLEAEVGAVGS